MAQGKGSLALVNSIGRMSMPWCDLRPGSFLPWQTHGDRSARGKERAHMQPVRDRRLFVTPRQPGRRQSAQRTQRGPRNLTANGLHVP